MAVHFQMSRKCEFSNVISKSFLFGENLEETKKEQWRNESSSQRYDQIKLYKDRVILLYHAIILVVSV